MLPTTTFNSTSSHQNVPPPVRFPSTAASTGPQPTDDSLSSPPSRPSSPPLLLGLRPLRTSTTTIHHVLRDHMLHLPEEDLGRMRYAPQRHLSNVSPRVRAHTPLPLPLWWSYKQASTSSLLSRASLRETDVPDGRRASAPGRSRRRRLRLGSEHELSACPGCERRGESVRG